MSHGSDARNRGLAIAVAKMRRGGHTNKEIALIQGIDVKRVPGLAKTGALLLTLTDHELRELP